MASILRRALRNQPKSASTIISQLNKSRPPISAVAPPPPLDNLSESSPLQIPIFLKPKLEYPNPSSSSLFYPSFSLGFFLNPISATGLTSSVDDDDAVSGDSRTIWADSVKKKRKKKMNKHKLKKLRKCLRRKT